MPTSPLIFVVMGVSGIGKTTIGDMLAAHFHCQYQEGDALHPVANVEKMRAGTPLTDDDRWPWLDRIADVIDGWAAKGQGGVVACSALKRVYRDRIIGERANVRLVYLHTDPVVLRQRLENRKGHYMPASLLDSQLATLQPPTNDERPITVDSSEPHEKIIQEILAGLGEPATS